MKKKLYVVHSSWGDQFCCIASSKIHSVTSDKFEAKALVKVLKEELEGSIHKGLEFCGVFLTKMKPTQEWK